MFFQVYGHKWPDDGTAERFDKTRWRQWEKSCENAFEIAGGQKWGSTEPRCQVVRASAVTAIFLGNNKAVRDRRESGAGLCSGGTLLRPPFVGVFPLMPGTAVSFSVDTQKGWAYRCLCSSSRWFWKWFSVYDMNLTIFKVACLRFYFFVEKPSLKFWSPSSSPFLGFEIQCWISQWSCLW